MTGLAHSEASAKQLTAAGAQVHLGSIDDLDSLRSGAAAADGVIHAAYYHQISHMRLGTRLGVLLGGIPSDIVPRLLSAAVGTDRRALETLCKALAGPDRPLVAAFGIVEQTNQRSECRVYRTLSALGPVAQGLLRVEGARGDLQVCVAVPEDCLSQAHQLTWMTVDADSAGRRALGRERGVRV